MYAISVDLFLAVLVAAIGASFLLASVFVVLLQAALWAIGSGLQRHARSLANTATAQLRPKGTTAHSQVRA